ncbi:hypothetical protein T484DRAFT_1749267 [Baffinella frigidus]|nr:hypothetical protein T484DRAFT_1749267 [Cryptophyta sp. CCMP2293]
MSGTPDHPPLARSQQLDSASELTPFQLILRGLRPGSAQTIVTLPAPPYTLSDALINVPAPTAARVAPASSYYGEMRSTAAVQVGTSGETRTSSTSSTSSFDGQSSAPDFEGWRAHMKPDPPIRVGRFELLNDETGRELRVFRRSPCPPRGRSTSRRDEASGQASQGVHGH